MSASFTLLQLHLESVQMIDFSAGGFDSTQVMLLYQFHWLCNVLDPLLGGMIKNAVDVHTILEENWVSPDLYACSNKLRIRDSGSPCWYHVATIACLLACMWICSCGHCFCTVN